MSLLHALAGRAEEIPERQIFELIKLHTQLEEETPEGVWRRLQELRIMQASESGSDHFLLAEPVRQVLAFLFDEASPAAPRDD